MSLSEQFLNLFEGQPDKALAAPESDDRNGLLLIMYAEGISTWR